MRYDEAMQHCIFRFMSGSHAYGTNRPDSDEDYRGVFIAPLSHAFDLFQTSFMGNASIEDQLRGAIRDIEAGDYAPVPEKLRKALEVDQFDLKFSVGTVKNPGHDEELQELRKFLKLAADCNPNIIEFLYVDRLVSHTTDIWRKIQSCRDMFLSKKARFTFSGYAIAQLKRIKTHRGYLLSPPEKKPERADFGLPEGSGIPKEHQNAILSLGAEWLADGVRETVIREKQYKAALDEWKAYKKWERERNPARKEMERKYGYDVKHATHLVRLIRMAKEILAEGKVHVYRPDREELRGILQGEWPFDRLMEEVDTMDEDLKALYEKSTLRDKPDHKGIANLYREICKEVYGVAL